MPKTAAPSLEKTRPCPVTSHALRQLTEQIARLRADQTSLTSQGLEEGIVRLPFFLTARRLEVLEGLLARAALADATPCAAVGRRAALRDESGDTTTLEIVVPADGDPAPGCISADSPMAAAILGARVGDIVEINEPGLRRSVTVVAIDGPRSGPRRPAGSGAKTVRRDRAG